MQSATIKKDGKVVAEIRVGDYDDLDAAVDDVLYVLDLTHEDEGVEIDTF